ncbi:hypothetical protein [Nocardia sp. CC201C]|uniref:hypothetical protein n=1 Tax=Nocardia sp. CC201C TaxID=3044575 RepID=UPI0024A9F8FE|nr:hypothetical protein [Nocardia sp. CC201C]
MTTNTPTDRRGQEYDPLPEAMTAEAARAELLGNDWAATHYGVTVVDLCDPDDGHRPGFVALGHHTDPRRVLAAMNAFARGRLNWESLYGGPAIEVYPGILSQVVQRWATMAAPTDDTEGCPDYLLARFDFRQTTATPATFPVTVWGWKVTNE